MCGPGDECGIGGAPQALRSRTDGPGCAASRVRALFGCRRPASLLARLEAGEPGWAHICIRFNFDIETKSNIGEIACTGTHSLRGLKEGALKVAEPGLLSQITELLPCVFMICTVQPI